MQTNFRGLIQLLAKNLYPEPDVFIRELIQNAHDAIKIRRIGEPHLAGRIDILSDAKTRVLKFEDNGMGMDQADIENFLSTIGASGTRERTQQYLQSGNKNLAIGTIGQFGIGLLSAFVVAELSSEAASEDERLETDYYTKTLTGRIERTRALRAPLDQQP